jgi:hypothetical protein
MTAPLAKLGTRPGDGALLWGVPDALRALLDPPPEGPAPRLLLAGRHRGREPLAAAGFLGVAQVSLDAAWSALRFRPRAEIPRITRAGG